MSLSAERGALKTILEAVSGIGVVHDYIRALQTEADLRAAFVKAGTGTFCGCQFDRESTTETAYVSSHNERRHTWVIQVLTAVKDSTATGKTFQTLVEAICTALRARPTLSGTADRVSGPPQVRTIEIRDFAGVLAHYAEVTFSASEIEFYTEITT